MITEVSIRCQKQPGGWCTAYTRVYPRPQYTTDPTGAGFVILLKYQGKNANKELANIN